MSNERNYDDIINLPHHTSLNHPRMERSKRAAQFAPFAALTGYAEAINETGRVVSQKKIISNEEKEKISNILNYLNEHIKDSIEIIVIHFVKDEKKQGGTYKKHQGILHKIDEYQRNIVFTDKTKIHIDDILKIICNELEKEYYE